MVNFLASESARMLRGLAGFLEPGAVRDALPVAEYRIDDLAREANVSVRNIRVYQDRGLLPPPRREGRTGWYSESHLARLNLIGRMLDRGYTFATISELLIAAQYGMRVEDVLDTASVGISAAGPGPALVSDDELRDLFGADTFDSNLAYALDSGLLKQEGPSYRVADLRILEAAKLFRAAGVDASEILVQAGEVRSDLSDVARRFVGLVTDRYVPADGSGIDLDEQTIGEIVELVNKARALVHDVVHSLLVDAMEESIAGALEQVAQRLNTNSDSRTDR